MQGWVADASILNDMWQTHTAHPAAHNMQPSQTQQMYRLQQAQRLQQQRLFSQQQQQQQLQGQGQPGQKVSLSTIDPSLLTLQYAKEEFLPQDPTDPFSLTNDYDMLATGQAQQQGHGQQVQQGHSILSPLSTSPLDAPEYEGMDDLTPHGSGSLSNSPYGTPGLHQYYSMSVPVRGAGFHHPSHGIPVQQAPSSSLIPSGASGSSFQSSFTSGIGAMHGEESSLKQLDMLNEKRRRRRESHNAVERRRRDHINEKIQELSTLLPEFAGDAQQKPNKGTVLKRSVDYLRHMQVFATKQMERNRELENVILGLCGQHGVDINHLGLSAPLGAPIEMPIMTPSQGEEDLEEEQ